MRLTGNTLKPQIMFAFLITIVVALFLTWNPPVLAQQDNMQDMPGMDMQQSNAPETPAMLAKQASDKKESEFNHHLAGLLVGLAGVFLLAQDKLAKRWPAVRY
ncbi:MAG: hypothetical protein WA785_25170, partial [Candidatus Acidiferrales bacterium]